MAMSGLTGALRSLKLSSQVTLYLQTLSVFFLIVQTQSLNHQSHYDRILLLFSLLFATVDAGTVQGGVTGVRSTGAVQGLPHHGPSGSEQDALEAEGEVHHQTNRYEEDRRSRSHR